MLKSFLVVALLCIVQLNSNAQSSCSSSFSIKKDLENNALNITIVTNGTYTCTLFVVENGEFEQIEVRDSSLEEQSFDGLEDDKIYMVKFEFSNEFGLCKTRQLGGIKL